MLKKIILTAPCGLDLSKMQLNGNPFLDVIDFWGFPPPNYKFSKDGKLKKITLEEKTDGQIRNHFTKQLLQLLSEKSIEVSYE